MSNLYIATNGEDIWRWADWKSVLREPHTIFCIEQVSDVMFHTLMNMWEDPNHNITISHLLYNVLTEKWINNN